MININHHLIRTDQRIIHQVGIATVSIELFAAIVSLGWVRDYLYIPLGGSRHGTLKVYVEAMGLSFAQIALLIAGVVVAMAIAYRCDRAKLHLTPVYKAALMPLALYAAAVLSPAQTVPFIYFDF